MKLVYYIKLLNLMPTKQKEELQQDSNIVNIR